MCWIFSIRSFDFVLFPNIKLTEKIFFPNNWSCSCLRLFPQTWRRRSVNALHRTKNSPLPLDRWYLTSPHRVAIDHTCKPCSRPIDGPSLPLPVLPCIPYRPRTFTKEEQMAIGASYGIAARVVRPTGAARRLSPISAGRCKLLISLSVTGIVCLHHRPIFIVNYTLCLRSQSLKFNWIQSLLIQNGSLRPSLREICLVSKQWLRFFLV